MIMEFDFYYIKRTHFSDRSLVYVCRIGTIVSDDKSSETYHMTYSAVAFARFAGN